MFNAFVGECTLCFNLVDGNALGVLNESDGEWLMYYVFPLNIDGEITQQKFTLYFLPS
jgi:hypothetical protein